MCCELTVMAIQSYTALTQQKSQQSCGVFLSHGTPPVEQPGKSGKTMCVAVTGVKY